MKEYLKSVLSAATTLRNRVVACATVEDGYFVPLLSPVLQNLRFADGFVRNTAVLMGGTTIAMVAPIIAFPLLTRLYTPHQFGVFVSIVSVLSVPVTGNYDSAIMLPKKDREALNLVGVCLIFSLIVSAALFVGSLSFKPKIVGLLGSSSMSLWLPIMVSAALADFFSMVQPQEAVQAARREQNN
ncbi:MAG TPA: hypothetical protein DCR97_13765 [Deltaproteobacteria bacterium]|nr:hypothetical protein [Deltaproteobacteria bacterium]